MSAFRFRPAAKVALLAVTVGVFATALPGVAAAQVAQCRLAEGVDGVYSGPCAGLDADVKLSLRPHATADGVWVGDLSLEGQSLGAVEVTAHGDDQPRVIKSQIGWNIVSSFVHDDREVRLDFDTAREAPPTDLDLRIIRRASEILEMPANWDRADDRVCEAEDTTFSLYCSLHRASMDLTGMFHHRQPALQIVRVLVAEVGGERIVDHRLMDFNNHPDTTLAEVRALLARAAAQVRTMIGGR